MIAAAPGRPAERPDLRRAGKRPPTLMEVVLFSAAVLALFAFSGAWVAPFENSGGPSGESPILRAVNYPAYAAGALIALACFPDVWRTLLRSPLLIVALLVAAASVTWSIDGAQTMRRVIALWMSTFVAVAIASRWDWDRLAEVLAALFAVCAAIVLVTALLLPATGRMMDIFPGAWRGLWPEKNAMGGNMALGFAAFCAAAAMVPQRRWLWAGMAVVALFLVVMSTSKTSLLCCGLALGCVVFVALVRRGPLTSVATVLTAVVGAAAVAAVALFASEFVFQALGKDSTLTGRTDIWEPAMRQARERPLTGFGYGAVWNDESGWGPVAWITRQAGFRAFHAHNSWIAIWLETGLLGLGAVALLFVETIVLALIAPFRTRGAYLALPFLAAYGLMTVSETVVFTFNDLRWCLFVIVSCKLAAPHLPRAAAAWHAVRPRAWTEPVFRRPYSTSA